MPAARSVYLDNAATSWPKPPAVAAAMVRFLHEVGANPGRSGHRRSIQAGRLVEAAREAVAELFNLDDPLRVVFGSNVTEALNLALHGLLRPGDHVITSSMEHNSVMRPLRSLEKAGVEVTVIPCARDGTLDPALMQTAIRPNTRLIALTHASNVVGTLLPIAEIGQMARRHDLLMLVDTAATAGTVPIDMVGDGIDLLAFTGHKGLMGPTGTGGLVIGERVDIDTWRPLKQGGTGSRSGSEEQPEFLPDKFESGTLNAVGLAGLEAGIRWVLGRGVETIQAHHQGLLRLVLEGLSGISGITLHGTRHPPLQVACIGLTIEGLSPSDAGLMLDEEFDIQTRIGLHCAPAAHQTIGTYPSGTIRLAPGIFTSNEDVQYAVEAIRTLAQRGG
jgi:cysteine desulfurase family protein